jgi:hypothetical protein
MFLVTACSRDPKPGAPEAAALGDRYMRTMSDTLARANTFRFETEERLEMIAAGGEKRELAFTRKVTVRRPNGLVFELREKGSSAVHVVAYYDGKTATLSDSAGRAWAQTPEPETIDEMLDDVARRFGLPVPVGDVIYSSPYDAFIGKDTKGGFVGRETIDGTSCAKLIYADDVVEVRLWIPSSGPALPRRLELVYKQASMPLMSKVEFTHWQLDAPVTDAMFAFQPPEGHTPVEFGDFVAGVVSGTMPWRQKADAPTVPHTKPAGAPAAR